MIVVPGRAAPVAAWQQQAGHPTECIMSTILNAALRDSAAESSVLRALGTMLRGSWAAYMARRQQNLAVAKLRAMSDRELKDIGLSCSQIEMAVRDERDRVFLSYR
jgi:uncharacterized protein YjiS (DUF1127 family)